MQGLPETLNWISIGQQFINLEFSMGPYYKKERFISPEDAINYIQKNEITTFQVRNTKHLFFEVDLDDYHAAISENRPSHIPPIARSCKCKDRECCDICWVEIGRKPLLECLKFCKEVMGFEKVLPLFSGGRGFWIIISDERVFNWDQEARKVFAQKVPAFIDKKVTISSNHLMKVPYTQHIRTKKLCVPIDDPENFVPN